MMALGQLDQFVHGAMAEPRVGWMGDRLGLHRGIDRHPLAVARRQCPGLVRHRQALLDQRRELLLTQPLAPMRQ